MQDVIRLSECSWAKFVLLVNWINTMIPLCSDKVHRARWTLDCPNILLLKFQTHRSLEARVQIVWNTVSRRHSSKHSKWWESIMQELAKATNGFHIWRHKKVTIYQRYDLIWVCCYKIDILSKKRWCSGLILECMNKKILLMQNLEQISSTKNSLFSLNLRL